MSVIAKFRAKNAAASEAGGQNPGGEDAAADPRLQRQEAEAALSAMDRRVKPPVFTFGRVLAVVIVLAVLGVGGYGYVRFGLERTLSVAAERVTVSNVELASFRDYVPVTGSVSPEDTVYLDTIESGQVTEVLVDEGVIVEAGDLLARMKNTRLELEVVSAEAQLTEQQNNLDNARLAFQQSELRSRRDLMSVEFEIDRLTDALARRRPLEGSAAPRAEIEDLEDELAHQTALKDVIEQSWEAERALSERTIAQREASIESMTERLALVQEGLSNLSLTAPIAGQLTVFDLNVGEVVGSGQRIGQVDAVGNFKVVALVDEFYLGRISIGQSASVEIGGRAYDLEVDKVYPNVRDRQFEVDLVFAGAPPEGLRRGQTVRPRIELGETAESLVIANGPFYDETGGLWVLVVTPDGSSAHRRDVTLGRRNPEMVEVLSGLAEGERVITSSYQSFRDIERIDFN
ncbi:MAG: HlyD family efflux transporter periplasmic adaptor subunit [Maricaulaceae bacterium]